MRILDAIWKISPMFLVYLLWLVNDINTMAMVAVLLFGVKALGTETDEGLIRAQRNYISALEVVKDKYLSLPKAG